MAGADKTVIWLADGSDNSLTDGSEWEDEDLNAALYSADDLSIAGTGSLSVSANYADGITSKDGLIIAGGDITVDARNNFV